MKKNDRKIKLLQRRRYRIRKTVVGTAERPRLVVKFTNLHIHAQVIVDGEGRTILGGSTTQKDLRAQKSLPNVAGAKAFGKLFGEKAKAAGVNAIVFDRAGRRYHGTVKAFAEALREAGLQF